MSLEFTEAENQALLSVDYKTLWNEQNYQSQVLLCYRILESAKVPKDAIQRMKDLLPPRPLLGEHDIMLSEYANYCCDGAAFYVTGLDTETRGLEGGSEAISVFPWGWYTNHRQITEKMVQIDHPRDSRMSLVCIRQYPDVYEIVTIHPNGSFVRHKNDFHFAVDLGIDQERRLVFQKPGTLPLPTISYLETALKPYPDYDVSFWSWPKDIAKE